MFFRVENTSPSNGFRCCIHSISQPWPWPSDSHLLSTRWAEGLSCLSFDFAFNTLVRRPGWSAVHLANISRSVHNMPKLSQIPMVDDDVPHKCREVYSVAKVLFWKPNGWVALLRFKRLESMASWEGSRRCTRMGVSIDGGTPRWMVHEARPHEDG